MSISDNFNRADSGSLGSDWTEITHGLQIISTKVYGVVNSVYQWVYYSNATWGNDHSSEATATNVAGGSQMGVIVRARNNSGNTGYMLLCNTDRRRLYRADGGSYTLLQDYGGTLAANDVLKLEAVGTTLRAYVNGVQIGTDQTDATYATGGAPGIFILGDQSSGDALDAWTGTGDTGGGGVQPPVQAFCGNTNRVIRGGL